MSEPNWMPALRQLRRAFVGCSRLANPLCSRAMMKPLQIAPTLMIVAAAMAVGIAAQSPPASAARSVESLEARARRVQREAIVIDTHIDTTGHLQRSGWRFTDRHEPSDGH